MFLRRLYTTRAPAVTTPWRGALISGVIGTLYCLALGPQARLSLDSVREMLIARDCVEGPACPSEGSPSSFSGLVQGGLWIRFLAATRGGGFDSNAVYLLISLATGVAVALTFVWCARHWSLRAAPWASALFLLWCKGATALPVIVTQSSAALPAVLFILALTMMTLSGSLFGAGLTGAALYLLAEAHNAGAIAAPVVLAAILLTARKPLQAMTVAITVGLLATWVTSASAMQANVTAAPRGGLWAPAVVSLTAAIFVGIRGRARLQALPPEARLGVVLAGLCGWIVLAAILLSFGFGHSVEGRYAVAAAMPAAVACAVLLQAALGAHGRVIAAVILTGVLLVSAGQVIAQRLLLSSTAVPALAMNDARLVAKELERERVGYVDALVRLRGPGSFDLTAALPVWSPKPVDAPETYDDDLRVLTVDRVRAQEIQTLGWTAVALSGGSVAVFGPISSWLIRDHLTFCAESAPCIDVNTATWHASVAGQTRFAALTHPLGAGEFKELTSGQGASRQTYELPVRLSGNDEFRIFDITTPSIDDPDVPWRIESATGVAHSIEDEGRRLVLRSSGRREGLVRFTRIVERGRHATIYPPSYVETGPREQAVRDALLDTPPALRFGCEHHWIRGCP